MDTIIQENDLKKRFEVSFQDLILMNKSKVELEQLLPSGLYQVGDREFHFLTCKAGYVNFLLELKKIFKTEE